MIKAEKLFFFLDKEDVINPTPCCWDGCCAGGFSKFLFGTGLLLGLESLKLLALLLLILLLFILVVFVGSCCFCTDSKKGDGGGVVYTTGRGLASILVC